MSKTPGWQGTDNMINCFERNDLLGVNVLRLQETNPGLWKARVKQVLKRDNYVCHYCGKRGGILEVDHVIPFSRGGSDEIDNLTTSCRHCNRQKHDKTDEEFIEWRSSYE